MELTFCQRWIRQKKRILKPLSELEAESLEAEDNPYTIVLGDLESPFCFIERKSGFYGVNFLDGRLRVYQIYSFEELVTDRLFLVEVMRFHFNGDQDTPTSSEMYWFSPEGGVVCDIVEHPSQRTERSERKISVCTNWERKPAFGRYDDIIRTDRFQPLDPV